MNGSSRLSYYNYTMKYNRLHIYFVVSVILHIIYHLFIYLYIYIYLCISSFIYLFIYLFIGDLRVVLDGKSGQTGIAVPCIQHIIQV